MQPYLFLLSTWSVYALFLARCLPDKGRVAFHRPFNSSLDFSEVFRPQLLTPPDRIETKPRVERVPARPLLVITPNVFANTYFLKKLTWANTEVDLRYSVDWNGVGGGGGLGGVEGVKYNLGEGHITLF